MADENAPDKGGQDGADGAKEFKAITTQADLDRIIGERVARTKAQFADYDDIKAKATKFDQAEQASLSEIEKERKARETAEAELTKYRTREQVSTWAAEIVKGSDVPAAALRGSTREELAEHFEVLKALVTKAAPTRTHVPPGKPADGEATGSRAAAALREMRRTG